MAPDRPDRTPPVEPEAIHAGAPRARPAAEAITNRPSRPGPPPLPEAPPAVSVVRSTTFFDKELSERSSRPIWGGLVLVLGLGLLAVCWHFRSTHAAGVLGPPCLLLAVFLLRDLVLPRRCRFTEEGIATTRPRRLVKYTDICEVFALNRGAGAHFPIHLLLANDSVRLPARLGVSSAELVEFLRSQPLGQRSLSDVPPLFDNFLKQQLLLAAPGQIYVFRGNKQRVTPRTRRYRSAAWWLVGLAACWFALTPLDGVTPLFPSLGVGAGMFALIFLVGGFTPLRHAHARIKSWQDVALIVTPIAMALQQGDLRGELRWQELLSVSNRGWRNAAPKNLTSLILKVRGASIQLFDIYQWPLDCAAELIATYSRK